jgi:hypothetical protein
MACTVDKEMTELNDHLQVFQGIFSQQQGYKDHLPYIMAAQ